MAVNLKKNNAKNNEVTMEIKKEFGNVGEKLRLNLVSWNGADPKYDLRNWYEDKSGNLKYGKGITLTAQELAGLKELINKIEL